MLCVDRISITFRCAALTLALSAASLVCASPALAWKYKALYNFTGGADGYWPAQVTPLLANGDIYGTTFYGGDTKCYSEGCGVVFKLAKNGRETVLHTFGGGDDGAWPLGGLIQDEAGNFYGTAQGRGAHNSGVVFRIAPDGTFTVLHSFEGGEKGDNPIGLIRDAANGDLYGRTDYGGSDDAGLVYRLSADGTFAVLHSFAGDRFNYPGQLFRDANGNIYGATEGGGDPKCDCGTVYKLAPDKSFSLLYTFTKRTIGSPYGGLVMDESGSLYGLAQGIGHKNWNGSAFRIAPDDSFKIIHRFNTPPPDPKVPLGPLLVGRSGLMYGMAAGACFCQGTVFTLRPNGAVQVIYDLGDASPEGGGLSSDDQGNLYGIVASGGSVAGTIFELVK